VALDQIVTSSIVTLCVVGVDAGNAVTPSTGSDGVLYILHMGDGTIATPQTFRFN